MQEVTVEQCKAVVTDKGLSRIDHHKCTLCGYQTAYVIFDNGTMAFDPGCNCTGNRHFRPASFEDVVGTFNMQTPEIRARMWEDFQAGKPLID